MSVLVALLVAAVVLHPWSSGGASDGSSTPAPRDAADDHIAVSGTLNGTATVDTPVGDTNVVSPTEDPVLPGPPLNLTVVAGDGAVNLTWTAPRSNGTSTVLEYRVYRNGTLRAAVGPNTTFLDTGLFNEVTYTYQVCAVSVDGEGAGSGSVEATPRSCCIFEPVQER
jgi:hypothetical protein